jgi:hypothetical protein
LYYFITHGCQQYQKVDKTLQRQKHGHHQSAMLWSAESATTECNKQKVDMLITGLKADS